MPGYINSVQPFSITIATGATTGTATITAVGSLAFIIYQGSNGTTASAGSPYNSNARITLTSSTVVTATRGTQNGTDTITVYGVVVDPSSSLVTSVQFGTITMSGTQATNTATITAVNNANSAIQFLGFSTNAASPNFAANSTVVSLSGTTVTATKNITAPQVIVSFCVIEFNGAALNSSTQPFSISATPATTSWTQTITSVNTNNSLLIFGGYAVNTGSNAAKGILMGRLTNGTTITVSANTAPVVATFYNCTVVEFKSGILNSSTQRGTITLTNNTSGTATISSVNTSNAFCNYLGENTTGTTYAPTTEFTNAILTNSTTVTSATNTATPTNVTSYEVIEFSTSGGSTFYKLGFLDFFQ